MTRTLGSYKRLLVTMMVLAILSMAHTSYAIHEVIAGAKDTSLKAQAAELKQTCEFAFFRAILSTSWGKDLQKWKVEKYGSGKLLEPTYLEKLQQLKQQKARPTTGDEVDQLVEQYRKNTKIVLSLTTIPTRIAEMTETLNSMDLSSVDEVLIALPSVARRNSTEYHIPEKLLSIPKVRIHRVPQDLGPITKLLPAAELYKHEKALIITIDDDIFYSAGMIPEMIRLAALNAGYVFVGAAPAMSYWNIQTPDFMKPKQRTVRLPYKDFQVTEAEVAEGFGGNAYPSEIFQKLVSSSHQTTILQALAELSQKTQETFASDDLVISATLHRANVPIIKFGSSFYFREVPHLLPAEYGFRSDALHFGAGLYDNTTMTTDQVNAKKYAAALEEALKYFENVFH